MADNNQRYRKLTLLHSNDMHGDFLAENINNALVGGVSMLSGYISKVKAEEENVLYCVAGDMFRGSVIDSEYKGISTIEIMNMLSPDVVTIGNHETDYGVSHLLFIEKCARFPIINANLTIKSNGIRLFKPYYIAEIGGMKVLFIGILTEEVMASAKNNDSFVGSLVDVNDAVEEITKICNTFNGIDIDFTVLLTHIGYDKDKELARKLDPALGVDVIIGGHSHTLMVEPTEVNGILIVQAGIGTDQIGRFDIVVDTDNNCVSEYKWKTIPINNATCPTDPKMEQLVSDLKSKTDIKYGRVLRRLKCELKHEERYKQTEIGSFFSDIFKKSLGVDLCMVGSGSIRNKTLGPVITLSDMMTCYPYFEPIREYKFNGSQLKTMFDHIYREEVYGDGDFEFYQLSDGWKVRYSKKQNKVLSVTYNGEELDDNRLYSVAIRNYDTTNDVAFLGVDLKEIEKNQKARIVCTVSTQLLYEYLGSEEALPEYPISDRLEFVWNE